MSAHHDFRPFVLTFHSIRPVFSRRIAGFMKKEGFRAIFSILPDLHIQWIPKALVLTALRNNGNARHESRGLKRTENSAPEARQQGSGALILLSIGSVFPYFTVCGSSCRRPRRRSDRWCRRERRPRGLKPCVPRPRAGRSAGWGRVLRRSGGHTFPGRRRSCRSR